MRALCNFVCVCVSMYAYVCMAFMHACICSLCVRMCHDIFRNNMMTEIIFMKEIIHLKNHGKIV